MQIDECGVTGCSWDYLPVLEEETGPEQSIHMKYIHMAKSIQSLDRD